MSESRPEWLRPISRSCRSAPSPCRSIPTLTAAQARYILQDCGRAAGVRLDREQLEKLQRVRHELPTLEAIVRHGR